MLDLAHHRDMSPSRAFLHRKFRDLTVLSLQGHPMKPHRMRMTHNLLLHYGLHSRMEVRFISFS